MTLRVPRPKPCNSCPYRRDVPSGVWVEAEYAKLPAYDGDPAEQNPAYFLCHQADGFLCSGWVAHRGDPGQLLALRLGVFANAVDPRVFDYTTDVPLFASGAEAAAHGRRDVAVPGAAAEELITRLLIVRSRKSEEDADG